MSNRDFAFLGYLLGAVTTGFGAIFSHYGDVLAALWVALCLVGYVALLFAADRS